MPASDDPGFLIKGLLAGTRHTIYVRGLNGSRASPWISVTARTSGPRVADGPGVGYPLALTATSSGTVVGDVILNWTAPDEMDCNCAVPDSWQIEYEDDEGRRFAYVPGGVGQQLPPPRGQQAGGLLKSRSITTFTPAVGGSVTINSLTAGRIYTFYVRGLSGPFAGEWVGVSHNVGSRFGGDFDPPRNVRAIWEHDPNYSGQYRVVVTWDEPDPLPAGVVTYRLENRRSGLIPSILGGGYVLVAEGLTTTGGSGSYTIENVDPGTAFDLRMFTVVDGVRGRQPALVPQVRVPDPKMLRPQQVNPVTNFQIDAATDPARATLTWVAPTPPAGGYQIEGYEIQWYIGGGQPARPAYATGGTSYDWVYNIDMTTYASVEFDIVVVYTANSRSSPVYARGDRSAFGVPTVLALLLSKPASFSVDASDQTFANLTWTPPTTLPGPAYQVVSYEVEWDRAYNGSLPRPTPIDWVPAPALIPGADTTYQFVYGTGTDLTRYREVLFRIRVHYNGLNNTSGWLDAIGVVTRPVTPPVLVPDNLRVFQTATDPTLVRLWWTFDADTVDVPQFSIEQFSLSAGMWIPIHFGPAESCMLFSGNPMVVAPTEPPTAKTDGFGKDDNRLPKFTLPEDFYFCIDVVGLQPDVEYMWRIRLAYQDITQRPPRILFGPYVNFPTLPAFNSPVGQGLFPPISVRVTSPTHDTLTLQWSPPSSGVPTSYWVQSSAVFPEADIIEPWKTPPGGDMLDPLVVCVTVCQYVFTGLMADTNYLFQVAAVYAMARARGSEQLVPHVPSLRRQRCSPMLPPPSL